MIKWSFDLFSDNIFSFMPFRKPLWDEILLRDTGVLCHRCTALEWKELRPELFLLSICTKLSLADALVLYP